MNEDLKVPNNSEIDQALKEFERKAGEEQFQKGPEVLNNSNISQREVSGVKFDTDSYKAVKFYNETSTPKMVKLVMKISGGAIKEQRQAEYVLLGLIVVMFAISFYLFFGRGGGTVAPEFIDEEFGPTPTATNR